MVSRFKSFEKKCHLKRKCNNFVYYYRRKARSKPTIFLFSFLRFTRIHCGSTPFPCSLHVERTKWWNTRPERGLFGDDAATKLAIVSFLTYLFGSKARKWAFWSVPARCLTGIKRKSRRRNSISSLIQREKRERERRPSWAGGACRSVLARMILRTMYN